MEEYDEVEQIEQEHMMRVKKVEVLNDDVMENRVLMEKEHMLMMILYRMVAVVENYRFHCYSSSMMMMVVV
jgi:hypothetical protein